jgi:hypothetical protein
MSHYYSNRISIGFSSFEKMNGYCSSLVSVGANELTESLASESAPYSTVPGPPAAFASSSFGMPSSLRRRCPLADEPPAARANCREASTRAQENNEKKGNSKVGQFQREKLPSILMLMKLPTVLEFEKSHILQEANKATADSQQTKYSQSLPPQKLCHM